MTLLAFHWLSVKNNSVGYSCIRQPHSMLTIEEYQPKCNDIGIIKLPKRKILYAHVYKKMYYQTADKVQNKTIEFTISID